MLYGYPAQAVSDDYNWLHHCLFAALETVHELVNTNRELPTWPEILPQLSPERRTTLKRRDKTLGEYFQSYYDALCNLVGTDRDRVLNALRIQNKIPDLLQNPAVQCMCIGDLHADIHGPIEKIFAYAFDRLLLDLNIRDEHYKILFEHAPAKICPFCGIIPFKSPGKKREAYDHYLTECMYPFAGANLRNLVPMCHDCNSGEKLQKDVLRDVLGARRKAFDPYNLVAPTLISLDRSVPFEGTDDRPKWVIDFISSATAEVETWKDVFQIETRYARNILDVRYEEWLGAWKKDVRSRGILVQTGADIINELTRYETYVRDLGMQDQNFLKRPVFSMLRVHCEQGHSRLIDFLRDHLNK